MRGGEDEGMRGRTRGYEAMPPSKKSFSRVVFSVKYHF